MPPRLAGFDERARTVQRRLTREDGDTHGRTPFGDGSAIQLANGVPLRLYGDRNRIRGTLRLRSRDVQLRPAATYFARFFCVNDCSTSMRKSSASARRPRITGN